jgi:hypothetical protein
MARAALAVSARVTHHVAVSGRAYSVKKKKSQHSRGEVLTASCINRVNATAPIVYGRKRSARLVGRVCSVFMNVPAPIKMVIRSVMFDDKIKKKVGQDTGRSALRTIRKYY